VLVAVSSAARTREAREWGIFNWGVEEIASQIAIMRHFLNKNMTFLVKCVSMTKDQTSCNSL